MADTKSGSGRSHEQVVLAEAKGHVRIITLNNPSKLNIVSKEVAIQLANLYEKWEKENDAEMIVIKGVGRAFSAGGDLRLTSKAKEETHTIETFYKIYWRQYHIHTYQKTLVAFVNGIATGSGASLALACTFQVVTEKTILAAPEVGFGFHTDAGLSYILSRLPGYIGEYLALTGSRINGVEMLAIGLGTHYIPSEVRQARKQTLSECLKKEFRITINTIRGVISNDAYEGAQALIFDKDNSPKWNPPSLDQVTEAKINLLFNPLEEEFELQLPQEGKISRWEGKYECSGFYTKHPYDYGAPLEMVKIKSRM